MFPRTNISQGECRFAPGLRLSKLRNTSNKARFDRAESSKSRGFVFRGCGKPQSSVNNGVYFSDHGRLWLSNGGDFEVITGRVFNDAFSLFMEG